jgi:regulator of sigma D
MKKKNADTWEKKNEEVNDIIDSWINEKRKLHVAYLSNLIQAKKKKEKKEEDQIIIAESKNVREEVKWLLQVWEPFGEKCGEGRDF